MSEIITASRMSCFLACPRKHWYSYEIGLQPIIEHSAFRFGHVWHSGLEARALGADLDTALAKGVEGQTADSFRENVAAVFAAMLTGYFEYWGATDPWPVTQTEYQFSHKLKGIRGWLAQGKVDQISRPVGMEGFLIEHKSTSENVEPDSKFWIRLAWNNQLLQYADALERQGTVITKALFDVAKKPALKIGAAVPVLDEAGLKIVLAADGSRAMNKDGKTPRQVAGEGLTLQTRAETPVEYGGRLLADIRSRPAWYFARREVPILSDTMAAFQTERLAIVRAINHHQKQERKSTKQGAAWPRSCTTMNCQGCPYTGFCLDGAPMLTEAGLPAFGYRIAKHQELEPATETEGAVQ